jgi:hypothetical protein
MLLKTTSGKFAGCHAHGSAWACEFQSLFVLVRRGPEGRQSVAPIVRSGSPVPQILSRSGGPTHRAARSSEHRDHPNPSYSSLGSRFHLSFISQGCSMRRFLIVCSLLLSLGSTCIADDYDTELSKLSTLRHTYQELRANPNLAAARVIAPNDVDQIVRLCGEIDASAAKQEAILHRAKLAGMTPELQAQRSAEATHFQSLVSQFQTTTNHLQATAKRMAAGANP